MMIKTGKQIKSCLKVNLILLWLNTQMKELIQKQCKILSLQISLVLSNAKKDGSNSNMRSGGECIQTNQDAMPVFK